MKLIVIKHCFTFLSKVLLRVQITTDQQVAIAFKQLENVGVDVVITVPLVRQHMEHMQVAMTTAVVVTKEQVALVVVVMDTKWSRMHYPV